jgi:hypothetical protein
MRTLPSPAASPPICHALPPRMRRMPAPMRLPCTTLAAPPDSSSTTGTSGLLETYVSRLFDRSSLSRTVIAAAALNRIPPVASNTESSIDTAPVVVTFTPWVVALPRPVT